LHPLTTKTTEFEVKNCKSAEEATAEHLQYCSYFVSFEDNKTHLAPETKL